MTNNFIGHSAEAPTHALADVSSSLALLVDQAIAATIPEETAKLAVNGDPETLATLGRTIAVQEGYLIEAVVASLAATHPDRLTLSGVRLPLLPAALDLIRKNRKSLYEGLSLDATAGSTAIYHPDLVIVDPHTRSALIVDVKRSLSGYMGGGKLAELQHRMTASGLVLPDILWRDHQRLAVETVGTAIIDASRTSQDVSDGVWPISRLDDLLDIDDAGALAVGSLEAFRSGVRNVWRNAIEASFPTAARSGMPIITAPDHGKKPRRLPHKAPQPEGPVQTRSPITVGPFGPGVRAH